MNWKLKIATAVSFGVGYVVGYRSGFRTGQWYNSMKQRAMERKRQFNRV